MNSASPFHEVDRGLSVADEGGALTLRLSRPERGNALGDDLVAAIQGELDRCVARPGIHTVVVRSEGRHFCTGFDVADAQTATDAELLHRFVRLELMLQSLASLPARTVVAVHGRAIGAGADLVAACDVRLAAPEATFRFPGAQFGIVLGTRRLADRVGATHARRIVACGQTLDAKRAEALGLISEVAADLDAALSSLPPVAIDRATSSRIHAATRASTDDLDLADLVRSAVRPGLSARLRAYTTRTRPPQA